MSQSHPRSTQTSGVHTRSATFALQVLNLIEYQVLELIDDRTQGGEQQANLLCLFQSCTSRFNDIEWSWDSYRDTGKFYFYIDNCGCNPYIESGDGMPTDHELDIYLMSDEFNLGTEETGFMAGNIHALFIVLEELLNPET
jgi:hypothetical protein